MRSCVLCIICCVARVVAQCPPIISRAQWHARPPTSPPTYMTSPVPYVVIHHGDSPPCFTEEKCTALVRAYQNYHMDSHGWLDIGYSFVVGEDGNVYEARGWNARGAHCPKYNANSIGICVIGDFKDHVPNADAQSAVKSLIECGVQSGKIRNDYKLIGHRQGSSTDCPGNSFYGLIQQWPHWTANP